MSVSHEVTITTLEKESLSVWQIWCISL